MNLPFRKVAILNDSFTEDEIKIALNLGADAVMLRYRSLPNPDQVEQVVARFPELPFIINSPGASPQKFPFVTGFHHKSDSDYHTEIYKKNNFLIGRSCHQLTEVTAAESSDYDYVFLSAIFFTVKDYPVHPLGLEYLEAVCGSVHIPVFALGGINHHNRNEVLTAGAYGIAAVSLFSGKS